MKQYESPLIKVVEIEMEVLLNDSPGLNNELGDKGRSFFSKERDDYDDFDDDDEDLW